MKYESSFKSEADGLEISVMALIPDKKPYRAVVQLVHGMSEHKERDRKSTRLNSSHRT